MSSRSLRYYEQQGLIRSKRQSNGYREYSPATVEVVFFIQDLFAAGLSSELLREVIPCVSPGMTQPWPADLVVKAERVRDELLRQEQRLRTRRETLDDYLAGRGGPRLPASFGDDEGDGLAS